MEQVQAERIRAALEPDEGSRATEMTAEERQEALAFLKSPNLVERIGDAFTVCGLVGEETNRLAAYLACTSRKVEKPLAVIIQSTSAAGKSTLMEAVLAMFPEEERVKRSALFSRRDLRRLTGWSEFQIRIHLGKLEELEYVARRWGRQGQGCVYELLTAVDEPDNIWHISLLDVEKLRRKEQPATGTTETSCIPRATSCDFVKEVSRSASACAVAVCG